MRWVVAALCFLAGCGGDMPYFAGVSLPMDTHDASGPYRVEADVVAASGVLRVAVDLAPPGEGAPTRVPLEQVSGNDEEARWALDLPGRPAGSTYQLRLVLIDRDGNKASYPSATTYAQFRVLLPP